MIPKDSILEKIPDFDKIINFRILNFANILNFNFGKIMIQKIQA